MAASLGGQQLNGRELLSLPYGIKEEIWTLAIFVPEGITPDQLPYKANKFIWSRSQLNPRSFNHNVAGAQQLTAVQLSMVCKEIYNEVAGTGLFYKVNNFKLRAANIWDSNNPISYLVGITIPRTQSIRSVTCDWNVCSKPNGAHLFALLGACQGLKALDVIVPYDFGVSICSLPGYRKSGMGAIIGLKELFVAVRGLERFTLTVSSPYDRSAISGDSSRGDAARLATLFAESQELCAAIELLVKGYKEKPREAEFILHDNVREAKLLANLNIHGEGRLGDDKKPSVVASRTRGQLQNVNKLNPDGTLPQSEIPKYDLNGDFAWYIVDILASREVTADEGIPSVGFKIAYQKSHLYYYHNTTFESWEDVSVLGSYAARQAIIDFYRKEPNAYGKKVVHDTWKLGGGLDAKEARVNRDYEKCLGYLIDRQDKQAAKHH